MNRLVMTTAALCAVVLLCIPSIVSGQSEQSAPGRWHWGVGIRPAYNMYSLGDLRDAEKTFREHADVTTYAAKTEMFSGSFSGYLSTFATCNLGDRLDLGFSLGYWHLGGGDITLDATPSMVIVKPVSPMAPAEYTTTYGLSACGFPLELFALYPLMMFNHPVMARVALGMIYTRASIDYLYTHMYGGDEYKEYGTFRAGSLGGLGSLGLELRLRKRLLLKCMAGYMMANLSGFRGDLTHKLGESSTTEKGVLTTYDTGDFVDVYACFTGCVSPDARKTRVALTGMFFMIGLQMEFPCFL